MECGRDVVYFRGLALSINIVVRLLTAFSGHVATGDP